MTEFAPEHLGDLEPGAEADTEPDVLAPIRAVENVDPEKRTAAVALAVRELAESGQLDEVTKVTVKEYVTSNGLLKPGAFNSIVREAKAAQTAAARTARQGDSEPDEQEIAAAFLARGGDLTGAEVLDLVARFIGPYLALPSEHCLTVMVLWAAHTHAAHRFYVTPRLVFDSAEYGSGKTRALEVFFLVCFRPKMTISTTTAALYRRLAKAGERPLTILFDETDAMFNPRTAPQYEDLRAVLNAGYKRGATVDRCVGDGASMDVAEFPVFAPVALAGIAGYTPRSIRDRAVAEIHMRKRLPTEAVRSFEEEEAAEESGPVRNALAGWVASVSESLGTARPVMPDGVTDRRAENWRALLAIADAAGSGWPERARDACRYFVLGGENQDTFGTRLLRDTRHVFTLWQDMPGDGEDPESLRVPVGFHDKLHTVDILRMLVALEDSPWADLRGKPLEASRLKDELERYQVYKKQVRAPDFNKPVGLDGEHPFTSAKGYYVAGEGGLGDAWARYLPDHETYVGSDLGGNRGNEGNAAGQAPLPADGGGNAEETEVTAARPEPDAVTSRGNSVTSPADRPEPLTSSVTSVTSVPAMGGQHLTSGTALLERELGAQMVETTPNGHHLGRCATCGDTYDSPVHAITCAGYDPAT